MLSEEAQLWVQEGLTTPLGHGWGKGSGRTLWSANIRSTESSLPLGINWIKHNPLQITAV